MRVGLIGEGTYPLVEGGVSTWCDQLVRGLHEHDFHVVTIRGEDRTVRWPLPRSVSSTTLVGMWDPVRRSRPLAPRRRRAVDAALEQLWEAAFTADRDPGALPLARAALRVLATSTGPALPAILVARGSARHISRAWVRHVARVPMPLSDAARAAVLADRVLGVMAADWPHVDLTHVTSNGPAALMALARHWRDGTPFILTEHAVYLRERYLALADLDLSWEVRYAVLALVRLVCRLSYAEAELLAPVSDFNARWAMDLGAPEDRLVRVHNGVDPDLYPPTMSEPAVPTVSWVGRIDPLKDLHTLVAAAAYAREHVRDLRLRLFGPVPQGNEWYRDSVAERVAALGMTDAVTFEGPVPTSRIAAQAGHVVALSSISEGLPFTVVEAMLSGRATVSTDVGGVSEIVGLDGVAGRLVPAGDPRAMGEALCELLLDARGRRAMARAGRDRARRMFGLQRWLSDYRDLYDVMQSRPDRARTGEAGRAFLVA